MPVWTAAAVLAACALLAGCKQSRDGAASAGAKPKPVVKEAVKGPVRVRLEADRDDFVYTERLHVAVEVVAGRNVTVDVPDYGLQLAERRFECLVRDYSKTSAEPLDDQSLRWRQEFDIEYFVSGTYDLPPVTIKFVDERPSTADGGEEHEISTEPITVTVSSPTPEEVSVEKLVELPTLSPRDLPAEASPRRMWIWAGIGAALVLATAITVQLLRRRGSRVAHATPPHEWALAQLDAVRREQWVERGMIQQLYYRLSDIVRAYLELRFGLMAPDQTTDEFLADVRAGTVLDPNQKQSLGDFLRACDMVKFALDRPNADDIERSFDAAREFIQRTRPREQRAA